MNGEYDEIMAALYFGTKKSSIYTPLIHKILALYGINGISSWVSIFTQGCILFPTESNIPKYCRGRLPSNFLTVLLLGLLMAYLPYAYCIQLNW